jgi:hypothetical protein
VAPAICGAADPYVSGRAHASRPEGIRYCSSLSRRASSASRRPPSISAKCFSALYLASDSPGSARWLVIFNCGSSLEWRCRPARAGWICHGTQIHYG